MSDNNCETVRMIHYKIAFIKSDLEVILWEEQVVVSNETIECDGTSFEVWKTAEFFQRLPLEIPAAWRKGEEICYPPSSFVEGGNYYTGIPDGDKKYLRFFQEEEATYERKKDSQVTVLREIQKDGLKIQCNDDSTAAVQRTTAAVERAADAATSAAAAATRAADAVTKKNT